MTSQVRVEIVGDARSVKAAFGSAEQSVGHFGGVMKGISSVAGGILAAGVIDKGIGIAVDAIGGAITAGSDLSEQMSKTQVVFGKSAGTITSWGDKTASAIGLSKREALTAAGTFGTLLAASGKNEKASADWSVKLTNLAADMASFNNADITDTITAIQAGLRGESEPLRKYGVLLSDQAIRAELLAEKVKVGKGPLTDQQKQIGALGLIMKQTAKQQGDFARTSDGLANTQRVNAAAMADLSSQVGTFLLPAVTALATAFTTIVIPALRDVANWLGPVLAPVLATLGPMLANIGAVLSGILGPAFAAIAPIIAQVGTFIATVLWPAVMELYNALAAALMPIVAQVGPLFAAWAPYITTVAGIVLRLAGIFVTLLVPILKVVFTVVGTIIGILLQLATTIGLIVGDFITATATIRATIFDVLTKLAGVIAQVVTAFGKLVTTIATALTGALKGLFAFGRDIVKNIVDGILSMGGAILKAIVGLIPEPVRGIVEGALGLGGHAASVSGGSSATFARAAGAGTKAAGVAGAPITLNVYTTGDSIQAEQAISKALRRTARINGGVIPAVGWTGAG